MSQHCLTLVLVSFTSFSFAEAVSPSDHFRSKNKKRTEQAETHWNDKLARVGISSDGVPIVYSFPGLLLAPDQVISTLYCSCIVHSTPI